LVIALLVIGSVCTNRAEEYDEIISLVQAGGTPA
jgi:hypothetical protein